MRHFTKTCAVAAVAVCLAPPAVAAPVEYTAGHGDIGVALEDGNELHLHYHFGSNAVLDGASGNDVELDPSEAYVRVTDERAFDNPALTDSRFGFLGDSSQVFVLPASEATGAPYLGIAAEELTSPPMSNAMLTLSGFSGPGDFSLWQLNSVGAPDPIWDTEDGEIVSTLTDLPLTIGGHGHYNYGFTKPGVYEVTLTATADHDTLGALSDTGTFSFAVGSATAIPEPSSFAALASFGLVATVWRRRRPARTKQAC